MSIVTSSTSSKKHNIVVLEAGAVYFDTSRKEKRPVHAVGDGTFILDGRKLDLERLMVSKIPGGVKVRERN